MDLPKRPRSSALRRGRFSESGRLYLLTAVTVERQPLFRDWRTGRLLALELRRVDALGLAVSLAWVVMPDHLHWLARLERGDLASLMQRLKSSSAVAINRATGRQGPVWQPGYHDHAVRGEEDLRALARYLVANPLRAGLVDEIGAYPLWDAVWL